MRRGHRATWSLAWIAVLYAAPAAAVVCTPTLQWTWDGLTRSPSYPDVCSVPLVVQLTDDNGDGFVTSDDVPDVAFLNFGVTGAGSGFPAVLTALDGLTGATHFAATVPNDLGHQALVAGDLDGDGMVELVAKLDVGAQLVAFDHTGALVWTSAPGPAPIQPFDVLQIADLDQDGSPELFVGASVWNADGSFRFQGTAGEGKDVFFGFRVSNAVDLDPALPGLELVAGNTAYDASGAIVWSTPSALDGWTALGDLDGDGNGEVVLVSDTDLRVLDRFGVPQGTPYPLGGSPARQPVIADFDGDGVNEVFVVVPRGLAGEALVLDWSGSAFLQRWSLPVNDPSGVTTGSAFDFDGDGAAEILYADEVEWYVLDGRTGAILSRIGAPSGTGLEYPLVADIDGDCLAEVLVAQCIYASALTAYECAPSVTPRAIWNTYGFHGTNVDDDGRVAAPEPAPWTVGQGWIAQSAARRALAGADVTVCLQAALVLTGQATPATGCAAGLQYEWRQAGAPVQPWSSVASFPVPTATTGTVTYTLAVRCGAGCEVTDDIVVTVSGCVLRVAYGALEAGLTRAGARVRWTTLSEEDANYFRVERGAAEAGPYAELGAIVDAHGAHRPYEFRDDSAVAAAARWYRIVEYTGAGRGSVSASFRAAEEVLPPLARIAAGRRSRGGRRPR